MKNFQNITFIVFTYNHDNYIEESLESVKNQSIPIGQLIISNDGSTDSTKDKIIKFIDENKGVFKDILFIDSENNKGLMECFDQCLRNAIGDTILIQAGDDFSSINRAEVSCKYLSENRFEMIHGSYNIVDEKSKIKRKIVRSSIINDPARLVIKGASVPPFGAAFTRQFASRLNFSNKSLKNEDDYMGMIAVINGGLLLVKEILYSYRIHRASISSWNNTAVNFNYFTEKYLNDQANRIQNYKIWSNLIDSAATIDVSRKNYILKLIDKKIKLKKCKESIRKMSFITRLKILYANKDAASYQDSIIILLGIPGLWLINIARRFVLRT